MRHPHYPSQLSLGEKQRKKRKPLYDGQMVAALAQVWEIFDYSCGGRLNPLLVCEVDRLRAFGELLIPDAVEDQRKRVYKRSQSLLPADQPALREELYPVDLQQEFPPVGRDLRRRRSGSTILDRLLHHCHLVQISGNSYRLRGYAGLEMPQDPQPLMIRKRGRPRSIHREEGGALR